MPFFKRPVSSTVSKLSISAETPEEIMLRRARGFISTLQEHYPSTFAKLAREAEIGDLVGAALTLRGLSSIVDEAYIELVLQELQTQVAASRLSSQEALEDNPNALRIMLRSGNRSEAIALYQKRTGVDWQAALDAIKDLEQTLAREDAG